MNSLLHPVKKMVNRKCTYELKTREGNLLFWLLLTNTQIRNTRVKELLIFRLYSTFSNSFLDVSVDFIALVEYTLHTSHFSQY